jgi:hypothetical protein
MGFNKRYFSKETIITALRDGGAKELNKIINVDAMIMDAWATEFFDDYGENTEKYIKNRTKIKEDVQFSSVHNAMLKHEKWNKINSLACILTMLYTDPNWLEITRVFEMTGYTPIEDESGRFEVLKKRAIELVTKQIDAKVRGENLGKLV